MTIKIILFSYGTFFTSLIRLRMCCGSGPGILWPVRIRNHLSWSGYKSKKFSRRNRFASITIKHAETSDIDSNSHQFAKFSLSRSALNLVEPDSPVECVVSKLFVKNLRKILESQNSPWMIFVILPSFMLFIKIMCSGSIDFFGFHQCCGSMTFWGGSGSGSADPCLWLMDPDPDPAIFDIDLQYASKKLIFQQNFFCLILFEGTFTSYFKDKKSKRVTK